MTYPILFGWHFDGSVFPETVSGNECVFGELVAGPQKMARNLAMRMGIDRSFVSQAVRIAKYMMALGCTDDGKQFYSQSFALDAWSTASYLLILRDQLIASGWSGETINNATLKLQTLCNVELVVTQLDSPAEILRDVCFALRTQRKKTMPIRSIRLSTPLHLLPPIWQELFLLLSATGLKIEQEGEPLLFTEGTDIGNIQNQLVSRGKGKLENDSSFCLLEADDEYQLADVTSAWLKQRGNNLADLVAIKDAPTPVLDAACSRLGMPRFGGHENSIWRSALQVLPLMLQTCWLPANPYRTLELISLPEGPIPRTLSYHFIQALRAEPGFGGDKWRAAWNEVESKLRLEPSIAHPDQADSGEEKVASTLKRLRFWLEPKRHDASIGMPIDQAIQICRQVQKWASSRFRKDGTNEMYSLAINAAEEMEEALIATDLSTINSIQLNLIMDAVAGEGCKPEKWRAQASPWSNVDHPGQIWRPIHSLLWWGFTSNAVKHDHFDPWTPQEIEILAKSGIEIERPARKAMREAWSWRQALLNVQSEVLLCRPRVVRGQPVPIHPLWHEIEDLVAASNNCVVQQAHKILSHSPSKVGKQILQLDLVENKLPPRARRNWVAPKNKILQRPAESVTSMRELFGCSMAWALRYQAQLHPGIILGLADGDKLIGDIAHKLFRQLFSQSLTEDELVSRAAIVFDELVAAEGLPLLLRGRYFERNSAKRLLIAAAQDFSRTIDALDLEVVSCESRKEAQFGNGKFIGDLDIVLRNREGIPFIVDYKWNKTIQYRVAEIENEQHLQLAAYAWLEAKSSGNLARVGYYMLRQRRLIHCGDTHLDVGQQIASPPLLDVWNRAEATYVNAMAELVDGRICAAGVFDKDSSAADSESTFSLDPPCKICAYGNICGMTEGCDG